MADADMSVGSRRDIIRGKADLAKAKVAGSGTAEATRVTLSVFDHPELLARNAGTLDRKSGHDHARVHAGFRT